MPKFERGEVAFRKTKDFFFCGIVLVNFDTIDRIPCCVLQDAETKALFVACESDLITFLGETTCSGT